MAASLFLFITVRDIGTNETGMSAEGDSEVIGKVHCGRKLSISLCNSTIQNCIFWQKTL